ncbi:hypothetical protein [Alteraurantiacibacter palmitatis]|uniref:Uncharacterized protein n=1 Tax=Alteraurantiacibacter palmitatis TaxID=2054628 RepID=A0ABV7E5H7_9SPHN
MNRRRRLALALAAGIMPLSLAGCLLPPDAPTILASAGGTGPDDAYVVHSRAQEGEVLALLGLVAVRQELHLLNGRTFHVTAARNPQTHETRDVWFDISRFYGRE